MAAAMIAAEHLL